MKSNLPILGLIALSIGLSSCKKKVEALPSADFSFDLPNYTEGETIQLSNSSADAKTYRWTLPDGTTSKSENISYTIPITGLSRSLNFRLDAISESGLKSDYIVKAVSVKAQSGKLVLYNGFTAYNYSITIDGNSAGDYTFPQASFPNPVTVPQCGEAGYPTFELSVGKHVVTSMSSMSNFYTYTVTVNKNACSALQVY